MVVIESTDPAHEDPDWSEVLADYKTRVPNGSRSWHLRRSRNEDNNKDKQGAGGDGSEHGSY
jgi:hypothetical protein